MNNMNNGKKENNDFIIQGLENEELEGLIKELNNEDYFTKSQENPMKKRISQILFDKSYFILKILKSCIKILKNNHPYLAKGLEYVSFEIHDSVLLKSEDKTFETLGKIKENNKEMESIFNWIEECSFMKNKRKEEIETVINKRSDPNCNTLISVEVSCSNTLQSNRFSNLRNQSSSLLDFTEDCFITIEEPEFDIFKLESEVHEENTLSTVSCYIFITLGLYSFINYYKFENFLQQVTKGYSRNNAYHNDLHAADVEQSCYIYLKYGKIAEKLKLSNIDIASLLISAIIHDYKHPGYNNSFMINTKNEIAVRYNDQSVLENYHISESFSLIYSDPSYNIFSDLSNEELKIIRKRIIECVLSTDMIFHTKLYSYIRAKKEKFSVESGNNFENIFENLDSVGLFQTQQDFINVFIHAADISNPTKPMKIYEKWVNKIMNEFWTQGDKEKELKLPVSFLCDRNTTSIPAAQIGFIDGIVFPFFSTIIDFFPGLKFLTENCIKNKLIFQNIKKDEESLNLNLTKGLMIK